MYDLAIFAALGWERRAVTAALDGVEPTGRPRTWRGTLGDGASCLVVQTGLGLRRAREAAEAAPPARRFLVCGCAGALVASLRPGDLLAAGGIIPLDAQGRAGKQLAAEHAGLAAWAATARLPLQVGDLASSEVVLSAAAKVAAATTGALAVEMESAAVAAVARDRQIPFSTLRVVLDTVGDDLPLSLNVLDENTGELRAASAAGLVLRPWLWPAVVRLSRQTRVAEARLRTVATALVSSGLRALVAPAS